MSRSPAGGSLPDRDLPSALSRQHAMYRQTMAVCDELASSAVQGAEPAELTTVFAKLIGKRVVLLDAGFRLRASAGGAGWATVPPGSRPDPGVDRLLHVLEGARRPMRLPSVPGWPLAEACLVAPVTLREDTLGYLLVLDDPGVSEPDDAEFLSVTYAATLFALTLANERTSAALDVRYQGAVVEALVGGHFLDAQDAGRKARTLGLVDGRAYRVAALRVGESGLAVTADQLAGRIRAAVPGAVATLGEETVVVLAPEPDLDPTAARAALADAFGELVDPATPGAPPTWGLSERLDRPEAAPLGLRQAELAIDLGIRLGRIGQTVCYDQLGIYRLLFGIGNMRQLLRFADEVLGPLLDHDRRHKVDLVGTLSAYLTHHGSLKHTAGMLGLHANTVAYRAQRIQSLTGLDLSDPDDRLLAHVAVKIVESNRAQPAEVPSAVPPSGTETTG